MMRKLGLTLLLAGSLGLLFTALSFALDYQPMWIRSVKRLPTKDSYTYNDVAAAVIQHIERTRLHFYFGVICSVLEVAGAVCICKAKPKLERGRLNHSH